MTSLGLPFQGEIRYYIESSYGVGSAPTTTGKPISIKVLDAKVELADKHKSIRGFDSPNAAFLEQCTDYSFHIEYIPQVGDTLFTDAVVKQANCGLKSIQFYLETNSCSSPPAGTNQTVYNITGCVNKTCKISSSINNEYIYVMDFDVKSVVTASSPTGSAPSPLAGAICAFNIAGSISDAAGELAYITNAIDVTIDNGTKNHFDHDSLLKQYAFASELNISGSVDISLDEGGGKHLAKVLAQADAVITINLGGAGSPKLVLSGCRWKSSAIDVNIDGDIMKENAPFDATSFVMSTV